MLLASHADPRVCACARATRVSFLNVERGARGEATATVGRSAARLRSRYDSWRVQRWGSAPVFRLCAIRWDARLCVQLRLVLLLGDFSTLAVPPPRQPVGCARKDVCGALCTTTHSLSCVFDQAVLNACSNQGEQTPARLRTRSGFRGVYEWHLHGLHLAGPRGVSAVHARGLPVPSEHQSYGGFTTTLIIRSTHHRSDGRKHYGLRVSLFV